MEEVQSWWEVPAVAHFCYVFRSSFNLIYFEIAELESALLNIQDPEMSISLETLMIRLLQGFENETITTENWDENLHELFNDNLEDEENPYDKSLQFYQLTPRQKMEVLYKLCEMRVDVVDAMDKIKDIKIEDMKANCLGKDQENNAYWYFYDERLYKEMPFSSLGKKTKVLKEKNAKSTVTAKTKEINKRNRSSKAAPKVELPWSIVCFNLSEWESMIKKFSKSKNSQEKDLANNLKKQLPLVQESISEKDRLLRKRFSELAPKRQSSRILREQAKKREQDLKAQQEAERKMKEMMTKKAQTEQQRKNAIASERADRLRLRAKLKSGSESENEVPKSKQAKTDVKNQKYKSHSDSKRNEVPVSKQKQRTSSRFRAKHKSVTESEESNSESEEEYVRTKQRIHTVMRGRQNTKSENDSDFSEKYSNKSNQVQNTFKKQPYFKSVIDSEDESIDNSEEEALRIRQRRIIALYKQTQNSKSAGKGNEYKNKESYEVSQLRTIKNEESFQSESELEESSNESEESFNIRLKRMITMNQQNTESDLVSGVTDKSESESSGEEHQDLLKDESSKHRHMTESELASEGEDSSDEGKEDMFFKVRQRKLKENKRKKHEGVNYLKSGSRNDGTQTHSGKSILTNTPANRPQRTTRLRQCTKRLKSVNYDDESESEHECSNVIFSKSAEGENKSVNCHRTGIRTKKAKTDNYSNIYDKCKDHDHIGKYTHSSNENSHTMTDKPVIITCGFPNRSTDNLSHSNSGKMILQKSPSSVCTWNPTLVSKVKKFPIIIRSYRSTSPERLRMSEVHNATTVTSS